VLAAFCALAACSKDAPSPYPGMDAVHYTVSEENFPNPERGFYTALTFLSSSSSDIPDVTFEVNRKLGRTLYLFEFHLKDYINSDIADDYLQMIEKAFQALRKGGAKCILRFAYSNGNGEKDKPWDAPLDRTLGHIAQLKPLLQEYYDVIMVVQTGFVGSWGEWYYTDNYKDNASRKAVVDALLDAVPACRQIELRTPQFKMDLYGCTAADTITRATAHQETVKSRLAGHDDCYLADRNDTGTFRGTTDKQFWMSDSRYTIFGGETCGISIYCHCDPTSQSGITAPGAMADMESLHFTYVNQGYHPKVIQRWKSEGCYDKMNLRLGYRLALTEGYFTKDAALGGQMRVILNIHNQGFASVQNPRDAFLVLADASGKEISREKLNSAPRFWMPGETTLIDQTIDLPESASGKISLYLHMPDPCKTISSNPFFSIRLANEGVWEEKTGYNLLHTFNL